MSTRMLTATFGAGEAPDLAAFIFLAQAHGGDLLATETREENGDKPGVARGLVVSVTVEIPADARFESFKLCVYRTWLVEEPRSALPRNL